MPATKIGRWTAKQRKISDARRATRTARIQRTTRLKTSDLKRFCDICFEFRIRWRDRWTDGLDGRRYAPGDYEHYHACHYISRASLATRYLDENCHGQSSGHNWAMSSSAPLLIRQRTERLYTDFMRRKYGQATLDELERLSHQTCRWTEVDWLEMARNQYTRARDTNAAALDDRLASIYRTIEGKHILNLILERISAPMDGD